MIIDWVLGYFFKDGYGLVFFDGIYLYEYGDFCKGEYKEWGIFIFNYGWNEVWNFLVVNVLFWFDKYYIDGMWVDVVVFMFYLDYCWEEGEWVVNEYGGWENLEVVDFLC